MKYQKALLCIALAGTLIFSGCGSTNNSSGNKTDTSSSVESTVETSTEDTDAKSDENMETEMLLFLTVRSQPNRTPPAVFMLQVVAA